MNWNNSYHLLLLALGMKLVKGIAIISTVFTIWLIYYILANPIYIIDLITK